MEMCTMNTIPALVFALFSISTARAEIVRSGVADGYLH
jgi:hypothetical protein